MSMSNSPYNSREVARAKESLRSEVEMGSLRFWRKKLSSSGSESFPNVWEGESGFMEHIKDTFPMPWKSNKLESKTCGPSSKDQASKSKAQLDNNEGSDSTSNSSPSLNNSNPAEDKNVSLSESDEEDCVLLEEKKVIIEIEDDCDSSSSDDSKSVPSPDPHSNSVLSKDEVVHWQKLIVLQKEIIAAKSNLRKTKALFQFNNDVTKGCDGMISLHGHIVELVSKLSKAKADIDTCGFSFSLTRDISEKCFRHSGNPDSYGETWCSLNILMNSFMQVRKKRKGNIVKLGKYQELSLGQYKKFIQRIREKMPR